MNIINNIVSFFSTKPAQPASVLEACNGKFPAGQCVEYLGKWAHENSHVLVGGITVGAITLLVLAKLSSCCTQKK